MQPQPLTRTQRRAVLRSAGETQANIAIEVVPGIALAPATVGNSYYWTTPGGTLVRHHGVFAARNWPTVYHHSTRRVIVGADWLKVVTRG